MDSNRLIYLYGTVFAFSLSVIFLLSTLGAVIGGVSVLFVGVLGFLTLVCSVSLVANVRSLIHVERSWVRSRRARRSTQTGSEILQD